MRSDARGDLLGKQKPGRKPSLEITDVQLRTLKAIRGFLSQHGYPPTAVELGRILGVADATIHEQINHLVRKGFLKKEPGKARGLNILKEPVSTMPSLVSMPIVGEVAAGLPILAEENVIGEVMIESSVISGGRCFALAVKGDSMKDAGIHEGDMLIVRQQRVAESGDIVVALIGNEATVKRLFISDHQIELRPENPDYRPIPIGPDDDLLIVGKVIAVRSTASN